MSKQAIKNFKKLQGLSNKTIENYTGGFKRVKNIIGRIQINSYKKVIDKINAEVEDPATRGGLYTAIIKFMELKNPELKPTNEPETKEEKAFVAYKIEATKEKKTYNEAPKVIPEDIKDLKLKDLQKKYNKYVKDKKYDISNDELLLGFYLLQPPRRLDYESLIYTTNKKIPDNQQHNYLTNNKIIFNVYSKTQKIYDQQVIPIKNVSLKKIIKEQKYSDNDTVFSQSKRTIQRKIDKATEKILGQAINIQKLRVLHNSSKFGKLKKEMKAMEEDAEAMAHSAKTKMNIYVRE